MAWCRVENKELELLRKARDKAVMSPHLKTAVKETINAINKGKCDLAYELSAVKSYITGDINYEPKKNHFREDSDKNKKMLKGRDLYSLLDSIHHDIAFSQDKIPSGMMLFTSEGKMHHKGKPVVSHPIVKMMRAEQKQIYEEVKKRKR